jgi:hypothetical protein
MTTPILSLTEWASGQAQPDATVNTDIRWLEAFAPLIVLAQQNAPPGSPAEGDRYIVGTAGSGAWSGHNNQVALRMNGAWAFKTAPNGTQAYIIGSSSEKRYLSGTWT